MVLFRIGIEELTIVGGPFTCSIIILAQRMCVEVTAYIDCEDKIDFVVCFAHVLLFTQRLPMMKMMMMMTTAEKVGGNGKKDETRKYENGRTHMPGGALIE